MRAWLGVLLASVCISVAGEKGPEMVEIQAQFVKATAEQMEKAREGTKEVAGGSVLLREEELEKILKSLKAEGAEIPGRLRTVTLSGRTATVEAVRTVRYPTEWEPAKGGAGEVTPTSFEDKNVGVMLQCQASAEGGGGRSLSVRAELSDFQGFIDYSRKEVKPQVKLGEALKAPVKEGGVWQPVFKITTFETEILVKEGDAVLFLPLSVTAEGGGQAVYLFLSARRLTVE